MTRKLELRTESTTVTPEGQIILRRYDLNDEETQAVGEKALHRWKRSMIVVVEWDFDETWIYWDSDLVSLEYYKIILRIVTPFNYRYFHHRSIR